MTETAGQADLSLGWYRTSIPVPAIPENTTYVAAGAVTFGVEYRVLSGKILEEHVRNTDPDHGWEKLGQKARNVDDTGLCVHVFDTATGLEYLRFDALEVNPHYHYITPGSHHFHVPFDVAANRDYLTWVSECLRSRLPQMLRFIPATELADRIEVDAVEAVMPSVERALLRRSTPGATTSDPRMT